MNILLLLLLLLITAIEFPLGGSSPYTSTEKINKNKYIYKRNNKKHGTNNTKHSIYKHTYYQNTHTIVKTPPSTLTHKLQNKLKQPYYKIHIKWSSHNTIKYPQYKDRHCQKFFFRGHPAVFMNLKQIVVVPSHTTRFFVQEWPHVSV